MLRSKRPNRFFGVNPQGMPSQGPRQGSWSREVPKDWRSALGLEPETESEAQPSSEGEDAAAETEPESTPA